MSTPHNAAAKGGIAKTMLMPGDPLRAKFIAETYLENPVEFNRVRGMLGFTGTYKGKSVSVMGSGMGIPSMGIYSYELYTLYDVDTIIRIGSAGGYREDLQLMDILLATSAYSESTYARCQNGFEGSRIAADEGLCRAISETAARLGIPLIEGVIHCSDVFYRENEKGTLSSTPYWKNVMQEQGCLAVEMESFALFHNACVTGKKAACIVTVSDLLRGGEVLSAEKREQGFIRMMEIALEVA